MLVLRCIEPAGHCHHACIVLSIALSMGESNHAPGCRYRVGQHGIKHTATLPRLLRCQRSSIQATVFVTNNMHAHEYRKFERLQCTTRSKLNSPGARIGSTSTGITSLGMNLPSSNNFDSGFSMRC